KSRIASFQVIVPFFGGDLARFARVVLLFGHPYSSVIAQRLRHERQLGLMFPRDRYTRRVYLRETGIAEPGAFFVGFPCGRDVAAHGIGRQVKDIAITAAAEEYGMTEISFELARDQVAGNDAPGFSIDDHDIQHLVTAVHFHVAESHLALQGLVGADQQLLSRLPRGIEGPLYLYTPERTVAQQSAVFPRERHSLCHALIDDIGAHLGQPVDIAFARTVIPALDRIIKKTEHAVAVVLVILGCIDSPLGRDAVRPARRILETESFHLVSHFAERGCRRGAGQTRAYNDHFEVALVGRVHQFDMTFIVFPFFVQWPRGDF